MELFIAGDGMPDIPMGLYGGTGTEATFMIVGNSRFGGIFSGLEEPIFAGEGMHAIKNRLHPTEQKGVYDFSFFPRKGTENRTHLFVRLDVTDSLSHAFLLQRISVLPSH